MGKAETQDSLPQTPPSGRLTGAKTIGCLGSCITLIAFVIALGTSLQNMDAAVPTLIMTSAVGEALFAVLCFSLVAALGVILIMFRRYLGVTLTFLGGAVVFLSGLQILGNADFRLAAVTTLVAGLTLLFASELGRRSKSEFRPSRKQR